MINNDITKHFMGCQKTAFETGINSIIMLQEHNAKTVEQFLNQSLWIPAQVKSFINEWNGMYKKRTLDFKNLTEQNYSKLEGFFTAKAESPKPEPNKQESNKAKSKN